MPTPRHCRIDAEYMVKRFDKDPFPPRKKRMAIRDWHVGQLCVLWVGGLLWEAVGYSLADSTCYTVPCLIIGGIIVLGVLLIPPALLVVTWKWFGGRNPPQDS